MEGREEVAMRLSMVGLEKDDIYQRKMNAQLEDFFREVNYAFVQTHGNWGSLCKLWPLGDYNPSL